VVGIFPTTGSVIRLVGSILAEQHDEWAVARKYFSAESLAKVNEAVAKEATGDQPTYLALAR
jgi:transposase-like protein